MGWFMVGYIFGEAAKVFFLYVTLSTSFANFMKAVRDQPIPGKNVTWWAIGVTGFIYLQFLR